jgi:DNA/RNA endonuclease YhcR with UshA esterase domain
MFALTLSALPALAQPGKGRMMMPNYDPSTETTLKGAVEEVKEVPHGRTTGVHLLVKAGQETTEVRLGPKTYLNEKQFSFAKGDQVEVVGSKVKVNGAEQMIAREVKKGDKTLVLRGKNGKPEWSGGPPRS